MVVVPASPKPRPPRLSGNDRNAGAHVNSPHHPNMPKKFTNSSTNVGLINSGENKRLKLDSS